MYLQKVSEWVIATLMQRQRELVKDIKTSFGLTGTTAEMTFFKYNDRSFLGHTGIKRPN